jgi:hypothetical protein
MCGYADMKIFNNTSRSINMLSNQGLCCLALSHFDTLNASLLRQKPTFKTEKEAGITQPLSFISDHQKSEACGT